MVDLVIVPNVRYNQRLQGLAASIGGSVSTERPSVPSGLTVFLLLRVPGSPGSSLGIPGPPLGFPWASLWFPGAPWASPGSPLGLPGPPWASQGLPESLWDSLGVPGCLPPGPPWVSLGRPGLPWASLGLLGLPWVTLHPPGVVAKAVQIP